MINRLCGLNKWFPQENDPERFVSRLQMNENGRKWEEYFIVYKSLDGVLKGEKCGGLGVGVRERRNQWCIQRAVVVPAAGERKERRGRGRGVQGAAEGGRMMGAGWDGVREWKGRERRRAGDGEGCSESFGRHAFSGISLTEYVCVFLGRWVESRHGERGRDKESGSFWAFVLYLCGKGTEGRGESSRNKRKEMGSTALIILQSNSLFSILKTPLTSLSFHFLPAIMHSALQWSFNRWYSIIIQGLDPPLCVSSVRSDTHPCSAHSTMGKPCACTLQRLHCSKTAITHCLPRAPNSFVCQVIQFAICVLFTPH